MKLSPIAAASFMLAEGLPPILQVTTRDRNLLALQADLLGAWALGVPSVLTLSGDPLKVGPYEALATPVGGLDSIVGVAFGALSLSLAEAFGVRYMPASLQNLISFVVLVVVLIVLPKGIVGTLRALRRG